MAALDGAQDCLVFNSGAGAIFAAVLANIKSGDHIISVDKPYSWAQKMFDVVLPRLALPLLILMEGKLKILKRQSNPILLLFI